MFYQFNMCTARETNSDQFARKDMDVIKHKRISNLTLTHKLK